MLNLVIEQGQYEFELRRGDDAWILDDVDDAVGEVLGVLHVGFEDVVLDDFFNRRDGVVMEDDDVR